MDLTNQHIKYLRGLHLKKNRQKYGHFLVEGEKSIAELLNSSYRIERLYIKKGYQTPNNIHGDIEIAFGDDKSISRISQLKTPPNIIALVNIPVTTVNEIQRNQWVLALDGINDPGNLGTIIRIADWFGVSQVLCSEGTVDLYNIKTLMATMGSFSRVEVHYLNLENLLQDSSVPKYFALLDGVDISSIEAIEPGIIVIGSEANGISEGLLKLTHTPITIVGRGKAESLNAGVSAGIICHCLIG